MGRLLAGQKQWKGAQSELQAAARELPKNADLRGALAEVSLQSGDKKTGIASLKTLLELDPRRVSGARGVGAGVGAGRRPEKMPTNNTASTCRPKPSDAAIVAERAVVLEKLGRHG